VLDRPLLFLAVLYQAIRVLVVFFSCTCICESKISNNSLTNCAGLNGIRSNSNLPASILDKSRTSLIIANKVWPQFFMTYAIFRCSSLSDVSRRRSVIPKIPFIGVRISWLMVAKNSLLAIVACCAFVNASPSSSVR